MYRQGEDAMVKAFLELQDLVFGVTERLNRLEAQVSQNSRNSSKPPWPLEGPLSSDGYRKPAPKSLRQPSERKTGGQAGHPGASLEIVTQPDYIVDVWPERCECCGEPLGKTHAHGYEARQVHDIPPTDGGFPRSR